MAKKEKKPKKLSVKDEIEQRLADIVIHKEYNTSSMNDQEDLRDFSSYIDLFDAKRTEKDYDWMSDIFIPEFSTHMLTQSAMDVSQYFQTRDFVECYVMDSSIAGLAAAEAAETCINRTLNRGKLYHYHKYVRAKTITNIAGEVYLHAWWRKDITENKLHVTPNFELKDGEGATPEETIDDTVIHADYFDYEVLDKRHVRTSNEYTYSLQEKSFVIIHSTTNYHKLKQEKEMFSYINLDRVEQLGKGGMTDIEMKTSHADKPFQKTNDGIEDDLDRYVRYGKFFIKDGKPGIDRDGNPLKDADFEECVMIFVRKGSQSVLIAFYEQPNKDYFGNPYKPITRGICYIHPTKDGGVGDGKYSRELQIAINDTFNISQDRVMLATLPTMKARKYSTEDTDSVFFSPNHVMELDDPNDVVEFQISDNIVGALNQMGILKNKMDEGTAVFPGTMGNLPAQASTTATAVVGAEQRSSQRGNYKAMTFENTALQELYWMILQMTWQYAEEETARNLMGDAVYDFKPHLDYFYKPLSQSIETEQSKSTKIKYLNSMLGYVTNMMQVNPQGATNVANLIIAKIFELMGDEYDTFSDALMPPEETNPNPQGGGPQGEQPKQLQELVSNQNQIPQSGSEAYARMQAGEFS